MNSACTKLAVVSINRDKYSETFIQRSFDFFPCEKHLLYGGYLPTHKTDDWRVEGDHLPAFQPKFWQVKPSDTAAQQKAVLRQWLQKERPDLVLAHYGPSGVAIADRCTGLKIPFAVHFHGYDAYRADILGTYGRDYPKLFALAQQLIVPSNDMQQQLITLGAAAEKVAICPYGADMAVFQGRELPPPPMKYAFIGRFVHKKAPDLLIRAFAQVKTWIADATLTMVGDGELLDECRKLTSELGLGDAVIFMGACESHQVASVLADSHVLVLPSRRTENGDSEGTPVVILEAGAMRRPVIATHHAGIPDVISDNENGILVPQNDAAALAEAMLRLANDHPLMKRLGNRALAIIADRYTLAHYHQALWLLLENAVSNARIS